MNYSEFLCNIKQAMTERFDSSYNISVKPIEKNNGTHLDGLIICNPDYNISPAIYLTPYYHRYLNGVGMKDICDDIYRTYNKYMPSQNFDTESIISYEKCQSRIIYKLINYDKNEGMLTHIPHLKYLDFAVVFMLALDNNFYGNATITIHEQLMKKWNVTVTDLLTAAAQNAPRLFPHQLTDLNELAASIYDLSEYDDLIDMYVLSNLPRINGAAVILYDGLLQEIADRLGSNLLLIPSSIHEFVILPQDSRVDLDTLTELINSVNEISVSDEEVLSNHPYLYDRSLKCLTIPV